LKLEKPFYSERVLNNHSHTIPNTIIKKTRMELGEVSIIKKETPEGVSIIRL